MEDFKTYFQTKYRVSGEEREKTTPRGKAVARTGVRKVARMDGRGS